MAVVAAVAAAAAAPAPAPGDWVLLPGFGYGTLRTILPPVDAAAAAPTSGSTTASERTSAASPSADAPSSTDAAAAAAAASAPDAMAEVALTGWGATAYSLVSALSTGADVTIRTYHKAVPEPERVVTVPMKFSDPLSKIVAVLRTKYKLEDEEVRLVWRGRELLREPQSSATPVAGAPAAAAAGSSASSGAGGAAGGAGGAKAKAFASYGVMAPFQLLLVVDESSRFVLDAAHCGDALVLSPDRLGAGVETDNRWLTVRGTTCFRKGKHFWTLQLQCCKSNNFFLGVCSDGVRYTNYLGNDEFGFGYYGGGNTYRRGASHSYGQQLKSGDAIGVYLDMDARTLSFHRNGQDLGVAFSDLPAAGVYPAFSMYTRGDHFTLTSFGSYK